MTISKRSSLAAITMALVSMSLVVVSTSAQARIKCWENSDGVRECGKTVPPEYSQQGHEEISSQGITVYSNTDDIQMTSDGKIAALDSTINLANKRNEKIKANLDKDTATAAAAELAGKQPSEDLLKDIESLERQIKNNDKFIADKHLEQEEIKKEYAEKIARFEQLQK